MGFIFKSAGILFIYVFISINSMCQAPAKLPLIAEKALIIGVGYGIDSMNIPEGRYCPLILIAHVGFNLKRNAIASGKGKYTFYLEPQFNPVLVVASEQLKREVEFGINVGFQHVYPLSEIFHVYVLIGAGPHYYSAKTYRQARGFIFSDNLGTGIFIKFSNNLALNFGFRLRHLSNAELASPNHGINTFNFSRWLG